MKVKVFKNQEELATMLFSRTGELLREGKQNFCFPSGETPRPFFEKLKGLNSNQIANINILSLDEWVGIGKENNGSCYGMLKTDLFDPLSISSENITFFNGLSSDLKKECDRIDQFLKKNPLSLTLVGVGMNGHIGLNEPEMPLSSNSCIIDLDEMTQKVCQKYFDKPTPVKQGITLGLLQLANSAEIYILITGKRKANIVKKMFEDNKNLLPATFLASQKNATCLLDEEAASLLQGEIRDGEYFINKN